MWAGMSMSGAYTRYEVRPCVLMPHTIYAKIAVQVIWGSNRVENLNVVARHVEVAEREVLENHMNNSNAARIDQRGLSSRVAGLKLNSTDV